VKGSENVGFTIQNEDIIFFAESCSGNIVDSPSQTAAIPLSNYSADTYAAIVTLPSQLEAASGGGTRILQACFASKEARSAPGDFVSLTDSLLVIPSPRLGRMTNPGTIRAVDSSIADYTISPFANDDKIFFHNISCNSTPPESGTTSTTTILSTLVDLTTGNRILSLPQTPRLTAIDVSTMKVLKACFAGSGLDSTQSHNWIELQDVLEVFPDPSSALTTVWKEGSVLELAFNQPANNAAGPDDIVVLQQGSCQGAHLTTIGTATSTTSAPIILTTGGVAREFPIAAGKVNELAVGTYKVCFATGSSEGNSQNDFIELAAEIEIQESLDATAPTFAVPQFILLGVDLVATWASSSEMEVRETSDGAWIGLYKKGQCDEENEWRHYCYLAYRNLPPNSLEGDIRFSQQEYKSAGEFELRYFRGDTRNGQGQECKGLTGTSSGVYLQCKLVAAAYSNAVNVVAGPESSEDFISATPGFEHVVLV
jgi:hypothetical protein